MFSQIRITIALTLTMVIPPYIALAGNARIPADPSVSSTTALEMAIPTLVSRDLTRRLRFDLSPPASLQPAFSVVEQRGAFNHLPHEMRSSEVITFEQPQIDTCWR
jgi:hypothetical protein